MNEIELLKNMLDLQLAEIATLKECLSFLQLIAVIVFASAALSVCGAVSSAVMSF
jgi:hypothetical protein